MDLCGLFRAMGDPIRFRIVELLVGGPRNVTEIVETVGVPQPNVSRHLKALREGEVICSTRRGKWIEYTLNGDALEAIQKWIEQSDLPGSAVHPKGSDHEVDPVTGDDSFLFGG